MPCEVVLLRVGFFKMAAVAMETAKMLKKKNEKHKNDHNRLLAVETKKGGFKIILDSIHQTS
jgi:hypothetical protein